MEVARGTPTTVSSWRFRRMVLPMTFGSELKRCATIVADEGNGIRVGACRRTLREESAAEDRLHAQDSEVISRNIFAPDLVRVILIAILSALCWARPGQRAG